MAGAPTDDRVARDVLESLLEGCQVIGFDLRYLFVNGVVAAQARRRSDELLGRTITECYPGIEESAMFATLSRCMRERTHARMENEFLYPDGSTGWFQLRFVPVPEGVCILSLDVSEARRVQDALTKTEEQLRHAQKMEAVGRLAGGLAHDFNNLLSVVLSYTELLLGDAAEGDPLRADLQEIRTAGERAAGLTRQLLAFSRQQVLEPRLVDINVMLDGMRKMLGRLVGEDVDIVVLMNHAPCVTKVDPGQIEQVIMNLVVNARDAMPRGGKLTIQANRVELDAGYAQEHLGATPGPHVMIAVTDTGVGMNKETQARMFEPFFTTKERGKGTGLGLSTVFGIVQQSGGHVWAYSEPGAGTTFKIYLPRVDAVSADEEPRPPVPEDLRGSETVLLVEDDAQVRAVAWNILRRAGYVVLEAPSAGEALLASEQYGAKIDLLLTDVVMPRMSGPRLAERLRASRPKLKTLFMSGYTDEAIVQHGLLDSGVAFLQKPFTPDALTRKVRQVLLRQ
jgi:signal transduction histidine kinase